jgi:DNA-binding LacI/PurR family transcriptional regulator
MKAIDSAGATQIAETLKNRMIAGEVRLGSYISSIRTLSREFNCAPLTAQRALKLLSDEGLVSAEPRRGYRVTRHGASPKTHQTLAFLEDTAGYERYLGDIFETQLSALQREALTRGWISAVLPYQGQSAASIETQLRKMDATALLLQDIGEKFAPGLLSSLTTLGMPVIGMDLASDTPGMDLVLRDEFHGGVLATEYLVQKGHRKIGWYGELTKTFNARRRFAGAAEVLLRRGIGIDTQGWQETENAADIQMAREYLQRPNRPKAILALWQTAALALARAARELGLKLGHDLELVGWSLEEHLERSYMADCPELLKNCATVTWSMADVGHLIFNRIEERKREPELPAARVLLPMKLRLPASR